MFPRGGQGLLSHLELLFLLGLAAMLVAVVAFWVVGHSTYDHPDRWGCEVVTDRVSRVYLDCKPLEARR